MQTHVCVFESSQLEGSYVGGLLYPQLNLPLTGSPNFQQSLQHHLQWMTSNIERGRTHFEATPGPWKGFMPVKDPEAPTWRESA